MSDNTLTYVFLIYGTCNLQYVVVGVPAYDDQLLSQNWRDFGSMCIANAIFVKTPSLSMETWPRYFITISIMKLGALVDVSGNIVG